MTCWRSILMLAKTNQQMIARRIEFGYLQGRQHFDGDARVSSISRTKPSTPIACQTQNPVCQHRISVTTFAQNSKAPYRLLEYVIDRRSSISAPTTRVSFDAIQARFVSIIEFLLNLLNTISTSHQQSRQDEWIIFLAGRFKFLSRLFS